MLLDTGNANITNIEGFTKSGPIDYFTIETKAAVMESRDIAGKVVGRLNLYDNPLFNTDLQPPEASLWEAGAAFIGRWVGWVGDRQEQSPAPEFPDRWQGFSKEEKRAALREELVDSFMSGLSVIPSQRALLLTVEYASSDPEMAAIAANAIAEVYIRDQIEERGRITEKATAWLANRATELGKRVIDSEKRLEEFRRKSGTVQTQGSSLLRDQIARMNGDLIAARATRAEAEARHRQVLSLLKSKGGIQTAAAVLDAPLIQRLREQETQILRQYAELRTRLRNGHPRLKLKRNELKDLQKNISIEVTKIVINLKNELEISVVREKNLKDELTKLDTEGDKQNAAAVTLRALQSEVEGNYSTRSDQAFPGDGGLNGLEG
jgi:succinoglycan biosynthesis transport protein ExoP